MSGEKECARVVASRSSHRRRWTWALADRARNIVVLTSHALWRGVVGVYNSDDLTHAASIAYYALLSLLPFTLLSFSMLGWVTADQQDRAAAVGFVLRYFPTRIDFLMRQLDALRSSWDSLSCSPAAIRAAV